jgi:cytochrome b561
LPKRAGKYSDKKTLVSVMLFPLIVLRLLWRNTHPVAPERSLPAWQQLISETAHWSLYALVLATTMTGSWRTCVNASSAMRADDSLH